MPTQTYRSQRKYSNDRPEEDSLISEEQPCEPDGQEKGQYYGLAIGFTVIAGAYGGGHDVASLGDHKLSC